MSKMEDNLVIDLFCGFGGASIGIEESIGRPVDIAVNHDPVAISMHLRNHPETIHVQEDIFKANLTQYVQGRHVAIMWASPDCTSHSKAKGGKPRERGLRILPMAVVQHAKAVQPDVIFMENVEEIRLWGPLNKKGYPIKKKQGKMYKKFLKKMYLLGYTKIETRVLCAADFGAYTTRTRWFAVLRRDDREIVWPEPTHSKTGENGLLKWNPIHEKLDLMDFGKSIFGRKKPLAPKTMNRIARGLQKFVFENPEPFIVQVNHGGDHFRGQSIYEPLPTITQKHGFGIGTPRIAPFIDKSYGGNYSGGGSKIDEPIHTITTVDHNRLVTPYIMQIGQTGFSKDRNRSVTSPLSTIVTKNEHCLCSPFLVQYHSEQNPREVRGQTVDEPIKTIDTSNRYGLVTQFLTKFYKSGTGQSLFEPIHTITTSPAHFGLVTLYAAPKEEVFAKIDELGECAEYVKDMVQKCTWVSQFIMDFYSTGVGQDLSEPLRTIVTKDKFALVTVLGNEYVILDIFLRMLYPRELLGGQTFPDDYIIEYDMNYRPISKQDQVAKIGNSVVPPMAKLLVDANCPYLKEGDRMPMLRIHDDEAQLRFA